MNIISFINKISAIIKLSVLGEYNDKFNITD